MTVRVVSTVYGRVLMPDTEAGYYHIQGTKTYGPEHVYLVRAVEILQKSPPGIVVDAGANYGLWSLAMAPFAEQVVAIEPQRAVYNMLCGTIALNSMDYQVFPHQVAIGAKPGSIEVALIDFEKPCAAGGLSVGSEPFPKEQSYYLAPFTIIGCEPVRVLRLSDCLDPKQRVTFIKMDIEGSEYDAILGSLETLARWHPPMFIESYHSKTDTHALRQQIEAMGYQVFDLERNFLCMPL